MAATAKSRKKSVARGKARKTTRARKAKAKGRSAARVAAGKGRAKRPAKTAQARKKGLPAKVAVAKRSTKKVVGKRTVVSAAAGAIRRSPSARIVPAARTVSQVPRAERSYARKPTPAATGSDVELAVPELAVTASVQGEVPAGGE